MESNSTVSKSAETTNATVNTQGPPGNASLYVGDLDEDVSEAMIYEKFSKIGNIVSIRVCRDMISRRSLGYAYVNFGTTAEAEKAIDELNFELLRNRQMRIMWSQRDPSLRKSGVGNLFIKNLDKKIKVRDLYDTFSTIGDILSCKIPVDEKGVSKGYGFVHFVSKEAADAAVQKLNGSILMNKTIQVANYIPRSQRLGSGAVSSSQFANGEPLFNNVFVKNFGEDMSEARLRDLFSPHGEIISVYVALVDDNQGAGANTAAPRSRGFGFVCFKEPRSALAAVQEWNGRELVPGRQIYAGRAMKKAERAEFLRAAFERKRTEKSMRYAAGVNLYVKNLDDSIGDEELRAEFAQHGNITSVKVMTEPVQGGAAGQVRSKGFGFVCFSYPDEATKAVTEMNGRLLAGKPLYVALAQRKEERRVHLQSQLMQRQMVYQNFRHGPVAALAHAYPLAHHQPPQQQQQHLHTQHHAQPQHPPQQQQHMPPHFAAAAAAAAAGSQMFMYPGFAHQLAMAHPHLLPPILSGGRLLAAAQPAPTPQHPQASMPAPQAASLRVAQAARWGAPHPLQPHQQPQQQQFRPAASVMGHFPGASRFPVSTAGLGGNPLVQLAGNVRNVSVVGVPGQLVVGSSTAANQSLAAEIMAAAPPLEATQLVQSFQATDDPKERNQLLGEKLFALIQDWYPKHAGKLTGMLLEIEDRELLALIVDEMRERAALSSSSSTESVLRSKVRAAMDVLAATVAFEAQNTGSSTSVDAAAESPEVVASKDS